ncbi:MAG: YajQ family cyclic di-GMP-binding protein [Cytophagales bacterium]|nr:YajQ family cyclic di-GMP-binding protein [Bernardetiaceae bacterium]MDW8209823.1 YajQ family cyclic di-GMP-binding protein [Cytophagales bacterium]
MPSFDIVNKIDHQLLDNAINNARKEIATRFDLKDSKTEITFDKKNLHITIVTANELSLKSVIKILIERMVKQHLDPKCLDFGKAEYASGNMVRKDISIKEGIDKEVAKKIVKDIKETGLKVQASIMDDMVRVSGKKIDDLQEIIAMLRQKDYNIPLQFVNMKRD